MEKKKDYIKKFMRWLFFAMTVWRHSKKLKPELETAGRSLKAHGRLIIMRLAVIAVEAAAAAGKPVKSGLNNPQAWPLENTNHKINYAATLLFNRFLFEDQTYADLKKLASPYFITSGVTK
ncbi:MAG: hypothetical protein KAS66_00255 [Candidatus Omnitrophica bacterium]|nr:hypothetical protein [Candidatus Omnitrophota bacterium]